MIEDAQIKQVFSKVAEEFAFMFAEEMENPGEVVCDKLIKASMKFSGPFKGEIIMIAPIELCLNMVNNVLGVEPSEDEGLNVDPKEALCEFINIFCGNLLTEIGGEDAIFDLYPPESEEIEISKLESMVDAEKYISLSLDEQPIFVKVIIEK